MGMDSEKDDRRDENWHIERPAVPGSRQALFRSLYELLHATSPVERSEAMRELRTWAGASAEGRWSHRVLSTEEVGQLAAGGLIEVGAQTLRFVLREGRNRQIRRMAELVDLVVVDLIRTRIGPLKLGDLPEGRWRRLTPQERKELIEASRPQSKGNRRHA